jgi:hypothetical protein
MLVERVEGLDGGAHEPLLAVDRLDRVCEVGRRHEIGEQQRLCK